MKRREKQRKGNTFSASTLPIKKKRKEKDYVSNPPIKRRFSLNKQAFGSIRGKEERKKVRKKKDRQRLINIHGASCKTTKGDTI